MVGRPVSSDGEYQFLIECSLHTHPTTETSIFHYIMVENARQVDGVVFPMCIAANCSWSFVYCFITLCVFCYLMCIVLLCVYCYTLVAGLLARNQYPEGPATGNLGTGFSWFPCVYKQMLRWSPTLQVATASPPDLNFLDPYFIFMYMHYNHCHG